MCPRTASTTACGSSGALARVALRLLGPAAAEVDGAVGGHHGAGRDLAVPHGGPALGEAGGVGRRGHRRDSWKVGPEFYRPPADSGMSAGIGVVESVWNGGILTHDDGAVQRRGAAHHALG